VGFIAGAGLGAACFGAAGMNALGLPTGLALVAVIMRRSHHSPRLEFP